MLRTSTFQTHSYISANIVKKVLKLRICCTCMYHQFTKNEMKINYQWKHSIFFQLNFIYLSGTLSLYDYIVPSQNGSKPFKCSICEKESNDKGNLRKHVENIHFPGTFSYTCKYCNETLSTRNLLNVHISKFHRDAFNNRQNLL